MIPVAMTRANEAESRVAIWSPSHERNRRAHDGRNPGLGCLEGLASSAFGASQRSTITENNERSDGRSRLYACAMLTGQHVARIERSKIRACEDKNPGCRFVSSGLQLAVCRLFLGRGFAGPAHQHRLEQNRGRHGGHQCERHQLAHAGRAGMA
jgi:hypothetical protein